MVNQNAKLEDNPLFQMEEAMRAIGSPMYSDTYCCELMAWLHTVGGNTEIVVTNMALNTALMISAKTMRIEGGSVPKPELVMVFKDKVKEIDDAIENDTTWPTWLNYILKRYNITEPDRKAYARPKTEIDLDKWLDDNLSLDHQEHDALCFCVSCLG